MYVVGNKVLDELDKNEPGTPTSQCVQVVPTRGDIKDGYKTRLPVPFACRQK